MKAYRYPSYYALAFSYRDVKQEMDFFEATIRKFSNIDVRRVLELSAGTAPYLLEWNARGYSYFGLDISEIMLNYARRIAHENGIKAEFIRGNVRNFSLDSAPFDLVYVLLGSLYLRSNKQFLKHLDCVGKSLKSGGLYIIDGFVWFKLLQDNEQSWTMRRGKLRVRTTYRAELIDAIKQTYYEHLIFKINDAGNKFSIDSKVVTKFFFPQEFLSLVAFHGAFEFLGWYKNFDLNEKAEPKGRQVVILRKK